MAIQLAWSQGGTAVVVETDGTRVVVRSTRAAAPGTPLLATVALAACSQVRIKVQDCRREPDGSFRIRGRWLDLSRAAREEILAARSD